MIYITGDVHNFLGVSKFSSKNFIEGNLLNKNDYVIICGDFGFIWSESKEDKYWLKWLTNKPWTTLFIDGNHENFDLLNDYPVEQWNGGNIHKITDSVYHLMRGEIFNIENKSFFCIGGAKSHDIYDGILQQNEKEKIKRYKKEDKCFRIEHVSWWKEELPSKTEYENGLYNLSKNNNKVDYILSHDCPTDILYNLYGKPKEISDLNSYLNFIKNNMTYKHWYFGHHHKDLNINNFTLLFNSIKQIN